MAIREKNILGAISEFFVRLTTNQYIDGILTFRNDLKIRQTKKIHFVNDSDVTNATVEYDSSVNKVKISKATQVNGADVLTTDRIQPNLTQGDTGLVTSGAIKQALNNKSNTGHTHVPEDITDFIPIITHNGNPNNVNTSNPNNYGLKGEIGTICLDTSTKKVYVLTEISST